MGFNTVAIFLNDFFHELEESPKTLTWMVTHPPNGQSEVEWIKNHGRDIAHDNQEHWIGSEVKVIPTFHADAVKFLLAGDNQLKELPVIRFGKTKDGKRTVTLEMPEGFFDRNR